MTDIIDIDEIKKILRDFVDARDWSKFHNPKNLSMALAGEAGELLEIFQWMSDVDSLNAKNCSSIKERTSQELADVMLYLIHIASSMDINLNDAICNKIAINSNKYPAELVKGSAKKYNEYSKE